MRLLLLLTLVAALTAPPIAGAQEWEVVQLPDGPSGGNPKILDIDMDGGAVWFATQNDGLIAYDGTTWILHTAADGGLRSNSWHNTILVAPSGDKWTCKDYLLTVDRVDDGGTFTDKTDDTWTYYNQPDQLSSSRVFSMAEDANGNMWFGIRDENMDQPSSLELLIENDPSTPTDDEWLTYAQSDDLAGFFTRDVRELAVDGRGRLWIVYYLQGVDVWEFGDYYTYEDDTFVHYGLAEGLPSNVIHAVLTAADGRVWLGANNGLAVLDAGGEAWTVFGDLGADRITDVAEDVQGHIWAATEQGVAMLYSSGELARFYTTADGLKDDLVQLIEVDHTDGTVWAVTEDLSTGETSLNRLESGYGPDSDIFAYPNPWKKGESTEFIKIQGVPEGCAVEVFDITGQKIRRLEAAREPYVWDSLDADLNEAPSGVYV
ncbi:MAG: two-component regulator propeller domain-containing protein, partial [Candidatus Eisenbacteria bacterium]|nr:two-component regulator propeller domain-containing protein [Candidatus Eisenbacteria bacterium]